MRVVVFAYSNVGDRCLRVLAARGLDIVLVVTHRDRSRDAIWLRRVADTADDLGLAWIPCDDPTEPALAEAVARARPDLIFSFYYAAMIPMEVLALAAAGAFNLHGSLLPQFRGRAPTNWAVLEGATETGATLHWMVRAPDAGDIVDQQPVPILPDDTGKDVLDKVTVAAEQVLWRSLAAILAGRAPRLPNDLRLGRYYSRRSAEDGRIDWQRPLREVYNLIRAVAPPYPGAFTEVAGRRLIVARALPLRRPLSREGEPGLQWVDGAILARCGDGGWLQVRELRLGDRVIGAGDLQPLLEKAFAERFPP